MFREGNHIPLTPFKGGMGSPGLKGAMNVLES
jgi:hypothetical protein